MSFTKRSLSFLFLIITLSFISPLYAQSGINLESILSGIPTIESTNDTQSKKEKSKKSLIKAINILGNQSISNDTIRKEISLKKGDEFDPHKATRAVKNIKSLGYFEDISFSKNSEEDGVTITFYIEENPVITKINFEGLSTYSIEKIRDLIKSKENTIYNYQDVRNDISTLEELYQNDGYIQAKIYRIDNPKKESPELTFYIGEGMIEEISITGNAKTKGYVISREIDIKPGDIINQKVLKENIRRIFNLNYFSNVYPNFQPGETPNSYKVIFELEEKPTNGSFTFGGGFSPNSGFSIFSDLYWDNIMGSGQLIVLKGNFGIGSEDRDNRNSTYQFKYHNPWAWDKRKSFTFRTWLTDGNLRSFNPLSNSADYREEKHRGVDVAIGIPYTYDLNSSHKLKYESIALTDSGISYYEYTYTAGLSYDSRDFRMNPREGIFHSVFVEQGLKFRTNAIDFTKIDLTLRQFIPTFKKQTFAFKTSLGYLTSPDINNTEIFRSKWYEIGGSDTVRGYDDYSRIGYGNKQIITNVEYRFLFTDTFQTVLFVDAGYAPTMVEVNGDTNSVDFTEFKNYKLGKGIGIRLNVPPLGPIRLDFGIGETGVSHLHFNIGHAF